MKLIMPLIVLKVSSWMEVIYMNIYLLIVKSSTRKQPQKQTKISQVCMRSAIEWGPYNHFVLSVQSRVFNEALNM